MKLVWCEWVDSSMEEAWTRKTDLVHGHVRVVSVGYLIKASPVSIILAPHLGIPGDKTIEGYDQVCGTMEIPIQSILDIRVLTRSKKKASLCSEQPQSSDSLTPSLEPSVATSTTPHNSN